MESQHGDRTLAENAREAGLEVSEDGIAVRIQYPNGRRKREIAYSSQDSERMGGFDVKPYVFLGDYDAVIDRNTGQIEARLISSGIGLASPPERLLRSIPGVELLSGAPDVQGEVEDDVDAQVVGGDGARWRLRVEREGASIELSRASDEFDTLLHGSRQRLFRVSSMKISGITTSTHDEALSILERFGNAFLLGLELRYNIGVSLARKRTQPLPHRQVKSSAPPSFPTSQYDAEPLGLYFYGRSASGLPLLAYLAYYQTLEYYFPFFSRDEALRAAKSTLTDPGFDPRDDRALGKFLTMNMQASRNAGNEREQLRATLRGCVEALYLKDFIESQDLYIEHFCAGRQAISGVPRLNIDGGQADLRDQVADRIYAIRCRVVHTKADGVDAGIELLLPSSREAQSLGPDVALLRYVAQRALIARASALRP
jgi:hypothetical protein